MKYKYNLDNLTFSEKRTLKKLIKLYGNFGWDGGALGQIRELILKNVLVYHCLPANMQEDLNIVLYYIEKEGEDIYDYDGPKLKKNVLEKYKGNKQVLLKILETYPGKNRHMFVETITKFDKELLLDSDVYHKVMVYDTDFAVFFKIPELQDKIDYLNLYLKAVFEEVAKDKMICPDISRLDLKYITEGRLEYIAGNLTALYHNYSAELMAKKYDAGKLEAIGNNLAMRYYGLKLAIERALYYNSDKYKQDVNQVLDNFDIKAYGAQEEQPVQKPSAKTKKKTTKTDGATDGGVGV